MSRFWDDATYPEDLPDFEGPQLCAICGADCEPEDFDGLVQQFVCNTCDERRREAHYAEVSRGGR